MPTTVYAPIPVAASAFSSNSYIGGSVPAAFDTALYKPVQPMTGPLKLVIKLRINLRPMPPRQLPLVSDADGIPFWTKPWDSGRWQQFVAAATWQANMWNNKFWLIPPRTFSDYDISVYASGKVWRPHIKCVLEVDFGAAASGAHRTIDVASLNTATIIGTKNSSTFRSHALLYDSLDSIPSIVPWNDSRGGGVLTKYTIAHEIGHAIGLGHIGALLKTPLCQFAIASQEIGIDALQQATNAPPAPWHQGSNSQYCYGYQQDRRLQTNVMGSGGANFTVENASPWLWAILHIRQQPERFSIVLSDPGAGTWVK